jgi:hypothetical protein
LFFLNKRGGRDPYYCNWGALGRQGEDKIYISKREKLNINPKQKRAG